MSTTEINPAQEETLAATHTLSREAYLALKTMWKDYLADPRGKAKDCKPPHQAWHHLAYLLLCDKSPEKIKKAFPPAHSPRTLAIYAAKGWSPDASYLGAKSDLTRGLNSLLYYIKLGKYTPEMGLNFDGRMVHLEPETIAILQERLASL